MINTFFKPLRKYWYVVLGLTVLASVLAGWEREATYESRARLLFKLGDEFLQTGVGPNARTSGRILLAEAMNSDVQILTSYDQYAKVVEELGADTFRAPVDETEAGDAFVREDAIEALRRGINVKSVENSAVIHLSYSHTDPARAKLVLATLIDVYFRERAQILATREVSVIGSIRDEASERFVDLRASYDQFLAGTSLRDLESTLGIMRQQLMGLLSGARDTRRQLSEDERQLAAVETQITQQPMRKEIYSEPRTNTALEKARNRLVELRVEEQQLLGKYTATSRTVADLRSEIAELESMIRNEQSASERSIRRTGNNPIRDNLEMRRAELAVSIAGAEARLETLTEQESALRTELLALEKRYVEAARIGNELSVAEARFRDVDQQFLEHRILADTEAAREANVRVIESPALPRAATGLAPAARFGLGALLGFLAGWLIAVWIELLGAMQRRGTGVPDRVLHERLDALESNRAAELAYPRPYAGVALANTRYRPQEALPILGEFGASGGVSR